MEKLKRLWFTFSWGITIFSVYKKLKEAGEMQEDFYSELSPDLQAEWDYLFGKPDKVQNPVIPPLTTSKQIQSIKTGV